MSTLKPIYLFAGDDQTKIDAARRRLLKRARAEGGNSTIEIIEGKECSPELVARALVNLSLAVGTRYLLADGVESWKAGELEPFERALTDLPADTVLVLLGRGKVVARLTKAVADRGGEVKDLQGPKPWELPRWALGQAKSLGLEVDMGFVQALVASVGTSQPRLRMELEKLALLSANGEVTKAQLLAAVVQEGEARSYELADAIIEADARRSLMLATTLRERGESVIGLLFPIVRQVRAVLDAAEKLEAGVLPSEVQRQLKMAPYAAKRVIKLAQAAESKRLRQLICRLADLDSSIKGGSQLADDTVFILTAAAPAGV